MKKASLSILIIGIIVHVNAQQNKFIGGLLFDLNGIGLVGNTGKSTAPHCHYEVHKAGVPINPIYFFFNDITPREYQAMLELSLKPSQTLD